MCIGSSYSSKPRTQPLASKVPHAAAPHRVNKFKHGDKVQVKQLVEPSLYFKPGDIGTVDATFGHTAYVQFEKQGFHKIGDGYWAAHEYDLEPRKGILSRLLSFFQGSRKYR